MSVISKGTVVLTFLLYFNGLCWQKYAIGDGNNACVIRVALSSNILKGKRYLQQPFYKCCICVGVGWKLNDEMIVGNIYTTLCTCTTTLMVTHVYAQLYV